MSSATTPPSGQDQTSGTTRGRTNGRTSDQHAPGRHTLDRHASDQGTAGGRTSDGGVQADRAGTSRPGARDLRAERREVTSRQQDRFGGMKFGSCFFGWLTATGTAVLLSGLLTAAGAALGSRADAAQAGARSLGLVAGIALLAVTLVAYLAGGYVAGRMARFNGLKQGLGVWLWAVIAAVVLAVLTLAAGARFDALSSLNALPQLPISSETATVGSIVLAVGLIVLALIGALLGGLAGMRFHRRVDATDTTATDVSTER